jgi:hypothetical protein
MNRLLPFPFYGIVTISILEGVSMVKNGTKSGAAKYYLT